MALLMMLWVGHFMVDSFTGIWPIYKNIAGLDLVKAGLIVTVGGFIGNILQIVFGLLGDRGWGKLLICLGILMAGSVSLLPYVDNHNYYIMGFLVLLTFLGSSAFHPVAAGISGNISKMRAGKVVAVFLSGGFVGYAVSQLLFIQVYRLTNGKTIVMFAFSVIVCIFLALFAPIAKKQKRSLKEVWDYTRGLRKPLVLLYFIMVFASSVHIGIIFLLPEFLNSLGVTSWIAMGGGHMTYVMGGFLGLLPAGHLADKLGPRQVMLAGLSMTGVLVLVLSNIYTNQLVVLIPLLLCLGAATNSCTTVGVAYGSRLFPDQAGTVSGLLMGCAWGIAGSSAFIFSWLADPSRGGSVDFAIACMSISNLIGLAFCFFLPRARSLQLSGKVTKL